MLFVFAIVISLVLGYLFWFVGYTVRKQLNLIEENELLASLINVALGISSFLIVVNLIGNILKDFNWALIITLVLVLVVIIWKLKDFLEVALSLVSFFAQNKITTFLKQYTDGYFWILLVVINFIYGLTAFSTTKLDRFNLPNGHVFNINQLLAGNYPLKYSFAPNIAQKYHYGSDILGAVLSKFSNMHPEVSIDILLLIFLNLSILTLYALTVKFLNTNTINKYLVPFAAFLAWGPITNLFAKNPNETIPTNFLEKIKYLTETRLNDAAEWTGLVLHWYFAPPIGIGIFFFLIALYLIFRFFEGERNLKYVILLGVYLSSFVIIDFSKFVILILGILVYILFSPIPMLDDLNNDEMNRFKEIMKIYGVLLISTIILGFVHGNCLILGKEYQSIITFYNIGTVSVNKDFGPFKVNLPFLAVLVLGFYSAYKRKENWVVFLLPFFVSSYVIAHLVQIQNAGVGKILMSGNLVGIFSFPIIFDFLQKQFNLENKIKLLVFYTVIFVLISFSTLMFLGFGDRERAILKLESGSLKYIGMQPIPFQDSKEEADLVKSLKKQKIKDQIIITEPKSLELLSNIGGIYTLTAGNFSNILVKQELISQIDNLYRLALTLDKNTYLDKKVSWLYITPKVFRFLIPPQARMKLLASYLGSQNKQSFSNKKYNDLLNLKEVYKIEPKYLSSEISDDYSLQLKSFLQSANEENFYLKQIANCPYFGVYNLISNDYDGDKIADIAFFDQQNKKWTIIFGKDQHEEEIDLSGNLLANYEKNELLIPMPSDYDGDKKTDIALFNRITAEWRVLKSSDSELLQNKWCTAVGEIPLVSDKDGDGKADFTVYTSQFSPENVDSRWPTLLSGSGYSFNDVHFPTSIVEIPITSDVDGDKKSDHVIYRPIESTFYIYLSSLGFNRDRVLKLIAGDVNSRVVLADYDGDGKTDMGTWTPENGKWEIAFAKDFLYDFDKHKEGAQTTFIGCGVQNPKNIEGQKCISHTFTLGKAGDIPMPGDYNGDNKSEIAVYSLDTSRLEILFTDGTQKSIDLSKYKKLTLASILGV